MGKVEILLDFALKARSHTSFSLLLCYTVFLILPPVFSQEVKASENFHITSNFSEDFINVSNWDGVQVDLKYSTKDNFLKTDLYGDYSDAWLHKDAAIKLQKAVELLKVECNECQIIIYDALRPRSIQKFMWDYVVKIKKTLYVANPAKGSIHNFGMAIDLSILDKNGNAFDMGTPYDSFEPLAQPRYEEDFLKQGKLTQVQIQNRKLLREIMEAAGFYPIYSEWWHFNAMPSKWVRENYEIVE